MTAKRPHRWLQAGLNIAFIAALLTAIEEGSRSLFGGSGRGTDLIVYAGIIIAIAVYKPNGLLGWWHEWRANRAKRNAGGAR